MDRSQSDIRVSRNLSGSWRAMTAAGVASISLACGFAQPALAEWWKSQAAKAPAATSKPVQSENGFAATIRRLMAESRRAAAQGDHAKAIQLAERAAKISEASAQLLGSAGECSPQETARFLAEAKSRANQSTTVAAQSKTAREPADTKKPVESRSVTPAVASSGQGNSAPASKNLRQPQPTTVPGPAKQSKTPPVATEVAAVESPLFGDRAGRAKVPSKTPEIASTHTTAVNVPDAASTPVPPSPPLPPSPSQPLSDLEELLAQSRLAAADGHLDQAIELAQRAVDMSAPTSLFGPASITHDKGANRWLQTLIAQRDSTPGTEELVFEPPVKISLKKRSAKVASQSEASEATAAEPVANPHVPIEPETAQVEEPIVAHQQAPLETSSNAAESSLWTEDLPPAPAPSTEEQRSSQKFSRTAISRAGDWVDADALEAKPATPVVESSDTSAAVDDIPSPASSPTANSVDATPEFPLGTVSTPGFAADEFAAESTVAPSKPPAAQSSGQQSQGFVETAPLARVPLKNRGHIQQVANQIPAPAATQTTSNRAPLTQLGFENDSSPKSTDAPAISPLEGVNPPEAKGDDIPVQRFPIQRVLQLQQRLETASSLNPGSAKTGDAAAATNRPPKGSATVPADWFIAPETKEPVKPAEAKPEQKETAKRGILKLRGRAPIHIKEMTSVPKESQASRQPAVAVSSATKWKSLSDEQADQFSTPSPLAPPVAGRIETSGRSGSGGQPESGTRVEPPKLSPPVSQVAFESTETNRSREATSKTKASQALPFPEAPSVPVLAPPPPEVAEKTPWYHDTAKPEKKQSEPAAVRKNSFAMIDQMAETLKMPVSTLISLIGAGGLALLGVGLVVLRATIRRQYD
ncbi:MAG: hypothetical protein U0941_07325 [Planctomycetaceae bacterium]